MIVVDTKITGKEQMSTNSLQRSAECWERRRNRNSQEQVFLAILGNIGWDEAEGKHRTVKKGLGTGVIQVKAFDS